MLISENDHVLYHVGVKGMRWGVRSKKDKSASGGRKTTIFSNKDGRTVNKLFGKRNRTKLRNAFIGDPKKFLSQSSLTKKKYASLSKEDKKVAEKKALAAMVTLTSISVAAMAYMFKNP